MTQEHGVDFPSQSVPSEVFRKDVEGRERDLLPTTARHLYLIPMQTIGRYEIKKELGRGAMGVVYLAHDPHLQRDVAVKTYLLPEGISEETAREFRERFLREARAAASLSHPGIVTIHDAGEDPARHLPYIAMEFIAGQSLSQRLKSGEPIDSEWVMRFGALLAEALGLAHRSGIVHRDIKPANILIREADGAAKIADFGVARLQASTLTQSGAAIGSPGYMSPEQVRGGALDGRSDLFSLAVVLYEALCGRRPFQGEDLIALAYSIAHDTQIPLSRQLKSCPAELDRFFDQALSKDPGVRFPDGAAFAKAFVAAGKKVPAAAVDATRIDAATIKMPDSADRVLRGGPNPATIPLAQAGKGRGRRRFLIPALATALLVAGGLAAAAYLGVGRAPLTAQSRTVSPSPSRDAAAEPALPPHSAPARDESALHHDASSVQTSNAARLQTPGASRTQSVIAREGATSRSQAELARPSTPKRATSPSRPPDDGAEPLLETGPLPSIQLSVPAATELQLALDAPVGSKTSHAGDAVTAKLTQSVIVGDRVAIPSGSRIYGHVVEAVPARKGMGDKAGSLKLAFDRVVTPSGARAAISAGLSRTGAKSGKKSAGLIGGGAAGGALLGKILGGDTKDAAVGAVAGAALGTGIAAGSRGQDVELSAGSPLVISLDRPTRIDLAP